MIDWSHYPNFTEDEFRCRCGCGRADMDPRFMKKLQDARTELGFAFPVSSGFRCPDYNERISTTGRSGPHTTGHAVDIAVSGNRARRIIGTSDLLGFTGLGAKQHGPYDKRFVHLDDLQPHQHMPRPHTWTYP